MREVINDSSNNQNCLVRNSGWRRQAREATALQKGLLLALQHDIQDIYIEGDNLLVIEAAQVISSAPWKIQNIVADIKSLMHMFRLYHLQHVYRETNRASH